MTQYNLLLGFPEHGSIETIILKKKKSMLAIYSFYMCISDDVLLLRKLKHFSDIKMENTNMQRNRLSNVSLESNNIKHPLYPTLKSPFLQQGMTSCTPH